MTNQLVGMFDNDTFNRVAVLKKAGQHMNIFRDQYRVHLERNPRYEHPPMIPSREWKSLFEDGKERPLRKARRYHQEQGGMQYFPQCNGNPYYY